MGSSCSCYETTSPCGPATQRVRVRMGEMLVERLLSDVVLVEQVIITLTQTLHSRRFESWQLWLAVSPLLGGNTAAWYLSSLRLCVICKLFILSKLLIGNTC